MNNIALMVVMLNPKENEISHIINYSKIMDHVYIVDNSTDDHCSMFEICDNTTYISLHNNYGIALALNKGCQAAIQDGYDGIITMDQDSVFKSEEMQHLISYMKDNYRDDIAIYAPWTETELFDKYNQDVDYPTEVMTTGCLMNLDIYQKLGGFKDWLFIDGVDVDYCLNAREHGYEIVRFNTVHLQHHLGNIRNVSFLMFKRSILNHNANRKYYMARNYKYLHKMYPSYSFLKKWSKQRNDILKIIFFEDDKKNKIKAILQGNRDYKKGIKGKRKI